MYETVLWKLLLFHTKMILAWFLWGSVFLRGELRKYAKKSSYENFESALYSTSVSMPLSDQQLGFKHTSRNQDRFRSMQTSHIHLVDYHTCYLCSICDVIKQNQSEVGNVDFKIEPNKAENVFCFLLFLASFICSYLWNRLTNFNGVFCKM